MVHDNLSVVVVLLLYLNAFIELGTASAVSLHGSIFRPLRFICVDKRMSGFGRDAYITRQGVQGMN